MTRAVAATTIALLLAGCAAVTRIEPAEPVAPPEPGGPTLVLEIVNRSPRDAEVSYAFESTDRSSAGEGTGTFPACEAGSMPFGPVLGAFSVALDEISVFDGTVPMAATDGFVILRLSISEDGDVTAANAPRWTAIEPVHRTTPILGCG